MSRKYERFLLLSFSIYTTTVIIGTYNREVTKSFIEVLRYQEMKFHRGFALQKNEVSSKFCVTEK